MFFVFHILRGHDDWKWLFEKASNVLTVQCDMSNAFHQGEDTNQGFFGLGPSKGTVEAITQAVGPRHRKNSSKDILPVYLLGWWFEKCVSFLSFLG